MGAYLIRRLLLMVVTLVGMSIANLGHNDWIQGELPFDTRNNGELDAALDSVRDKFGTRSVNRAVLLHKDLGLTVPLLPD